MNDLDEVRDLVETWIRFWGVPDGTTFPRMQEWMTGPTLDLQLDSRSYWDDGALVAFGLVSVPPSEARQIVALLAGVVAPDRRGEGIGTDLLTWQLGRSRRRLIESGSEFPMFIRAWAWNWFDDTRGLFEHHGLSAARQFDVMEKTISGREAIDVPKGIAIVPWDTDRVEEIRVVNNTAFADHWGAVPISDVNWSHLLNSEQSRPDLSRLATDGDRVAGYTLSAVFPDHKGVDGRNEAWVRILGVHPEWRRRGVASALMGATHNAFIGAGITHSILRVDAESPTGANRLYAGLGYRTVHSSLTYELSVSRNGV